MRRPLSTPLPAPRAAAAALLIALAALALAAAGARADSIVFIKDHDVWLSDPSGGKLTRVTHDGDAQYPYSSPSQANDGTIAVAHSTRIELLRQNGELIRSISPPALTDTVGSRVHGLPFGTAISPDGKRVAWSFAGYSCSAPWDCMTKATTGVVRTGAEAPERALAQTEHGLPRWVGDDRILINGGYLSHVNLFDLSSGGEDVHWFDDQDYFDDSSDLGEGDVSPDGRMVAAIHGYDGAWPGSTRRLIWLRSTVDARTAPLPLPKPDPLCVTSPVAGTHSPTWSPDGSSLAYVVPDGLMVARNVPDRQEDCARFTAELIVPGASDPDWGPADVAPGPRTGGPGAGAGPKVKRSLALQGRSRVRKALAGGVAVKVTGAEAGAAVTVRARLEAKQGKRLRLRGVVAAGRGRADAAGRAGVKLRFKAKAKRKLASQRALRLVLSAG